MPNRSDEKYVADILQYAREAVKLVQETTRDRYQHDAVLQHALSYLIMVVGEAASRLSDETRARCSDIPWARVIAMRHRLVHDYVNIDRMIVWEIATERLPELIAALETFTPPEPPSA